MSKQAIFCAIIVAAALSFAGCEQAPHLTGIQIVPGTASLTSLGETVQYKAMGTFQHANGGGSTSDITSSVTWTSSETAVSTINAAGLATAVSQGTSTIGATMGGIETTTSLTVSPLTPHGLVSIQIIPGSQGVSRLGESTQFIAIGTYNTAPITGDITHSVTWASSDVEIATIDLAGLALGNAAGSTTITAEQINGGTATVGTATLSVDSNGGVTLPLLSLYEVGLGTGTVTSSPIGLACGPGESAPQAGCTGNFVLGTVVTLTATPAAGHTFGGWSSNCLTLTNTLTGGTCSVTMNNNEPVGAIFN